MPSVREMLEAALERHQAGRLDEAESLYRQVLAIEPDNADCLHLLGMLADQKGRSDEAIGLITRAVSIEPAHAAAHNNLGLVLQRAGRLAEAAESYRRATAARPDIALLHTNLGIALRLQGDLAGAARSFEQAATLAPESAEAQVNWGVAKMGLGAHSEALPCFQRAVALKPAWAEAHNNLGLALQALGDLASATASFERALMLDPALPEAHNNLGRAFQVQDRAAEAIASFERALALRPEMAEAHNHLALALKQQGKLADAVEHLERAAMIAPSMPEIAVNLGIALQDQGRNAEAVAAFRRALTLRPGMEAAHFGYGLALQDQGHTDEALVQYEAALRANPGSAEARLAFCTAQLPPVYRDEAEIARRRHAYAEQLQRLVADVGTAISERDFAKAVGSSQPFFLAYQDLDDRALQTAYGGLVCRAMAASFPPAALAAQPGAAEKIRVGIVSGFFRRHSNWKMPIRGWLEGLDRNRFALYGYHTGVDQDEQTALARSSCAEFVQGPMSIERWRTRILADRLHVLIYPEVGMDPMAAKLAALRLAPVQCNSWGHPDTSGYPTLDYFLSSALMEPGDGQSHYSENLVLLPNLSVYCEPTETAPPISREELGLRSDAIAFWCGQSLFKYLPQYDEAFVRIAQAIPDSQFVFIEFSRLPHATELFRCRLAGAFGAAGLDAGRHCAFLPRLDQRRFAAASGACDIFLDSIGWSGCNSTLESLPYDLPIVTLEGGLMRGRHSAAILRMMGIADTIAKSVDDYVAIAVRLARDPDFRNDMKARIATQKHRVWCDRAPISALESFLERATGRT
ncbi:MAG TPA: tetratricopeptide repeat protein [Alphaproteobacteria bacterium]|nr:tetratricopeptide repeat protein [Alphaproteobacteria bacterium]